ncbi:MAG: hypothetical protein WCH62_05885 [Candidatus Omnitrophota bacterium]
MNKIAFWDSTVFATILGALIAGLIGYLSMVFQDRLKRREDARVAKDEDVRIILGIGDYLKELLSNLRAVEGDRCPSHVVLPFLKQVSFSQYNDAQLAEIRELYNLLVLKIHAMENFFKINDDPQGLGELGRKIVSDKHMELRSDVLSRGDALAKKIDQVLNSATSCRRIGISK